MKTLCVAAVVLSLISVCKPASLACETLLQPAEQGPDVLGRWYLIAVSSNYCWFMAIFNSLLIPSIQLNVTSTEKPNYYDSNITMKISESCETKPARYIYNKKTIVEVGLLNDRPFDRKGVVLHSRCQDCLVIRDDGTVNIFAILSRRPNITAAEMKEFEAQADCLGLYRPQVLNSDHVLENCRPGDTMDPELKETAGMRVGNMFSELFSCTTEKFLYYPRTVFGWAQDAWASIW